MTQNDRIVYQFPISHYCEKTRWNLDAKGLSYRIHDLFPGFHRIRLRRLTGGLTTVPVLDDRGVIVADSAAIAIHLEREYPDRPLLPADEAARARARELEAYFDETAGRYARQWAYSEFITERRGGAAAAFFAGYSPSTRLLGKALAPLLEFVLNKEYTIGPQSIDSARNNVLEALDRLERETSGDPDRYLVGDKLSIADISAASLLGPVIGPPGSPWSEDISSPMPVPPSVRDLRAELRSRPGGAWVLARYGRDRHR